jgi:hypothetical protein
MKPSNLDRNYAPLPRALFCRRWVQIRRNPIRLKSAACDRLYKQFPKSGSGTPDALDVLLRQDSRESLGGFRRASRERSSG